MKKDSRIDAYIAKAGPFAQPILKHLRRLIHKASPQIQETIKWGMPSFENNGTLLCGIAAFKRHAVFGFWKASLMKDPHKILSGENKNAMGNLGRITNLGDLPPDDVIITYIKQAVELNEKGIKKPSPSKFAKKKELKIPDYFIKALKKNSKAQKTFENFSYTNKKEYIEWITEAKTQETRMKRLETALEWMTDGKIRNWKYIKK